MNFLHLLLRMYLVAFEDNTWVYFCTKCFFFFLCFRTKVCATETVLNSARNPSIASPLSLLTVPGDSDFCVNPLPQAVFPVVQADVPGVLLPNGVSNQTLQPSAAAASKTENGKPTLLPSQPFLCFPSSSLFMLCGGLQENLLRENLPAAGDIGNRSTEEKASPMEAQGAGPPAGCQKRSSHECMSPSAPVDDEEPAAKKQTMEQGDGPLSLVVPKVKKLIMLSLTLPVSEERLCPRQHVYK